MSDQDAVIVEILKVVHSTEKAILVVTKKSEMVWIPRKCVVVGRLPSKNKTGQVSMPYWLAEKESMI